MFKKGGPGPGPKAQGSWPKGVNRDLAMEVPPSKPRSGAMFFEGVREGGPPAGPGGDPDPAHNPKIYETHKVLLGLSAQTPVFVGRQGGVVSQGP